MAFSRKFVEHMLPLELWQVPLSIPGLCDVVNNLPLLTKLFLYLYDDGQGHVYHCLRDQSTTSTMLAEQFVVIQCHSVPDDSNLSRLLPLSATLHPDPLQPLMNSRHSHAKTPPNCNTTWVFGYNLVPSQQQIKCAKVNKSY